MVSVNPLYAKAFEKQNNPSGGGDFEKAPAFKFEDIGDAIRGKVLKVGDPFEKENTYKGETRMVTNQVVTLVDVKIKRADGTQSTAEKMNIWLQKNGQFAAIFTALQAIDASDIPVDSDFILRWSGLGKATGDGARPHKFESKITPAS